MPLGRKVSNRSWSQEARGKENAKAKASTQAFSSRNRPQVGSAVVNLSVYKDPPVKVKDERLLFTVIRASFNQRRKTLQNGLNHAPGLGVPKEVTVKILEDMELSASVRGEALTLSQFAEFSNRLSDALA